MRCIVVRKNCLDSLNTIDENATYSTFRNNLQLTSRLT